MCAVWVNQKPAKKKTARRRLFNSNLMMVDQVASNAGFAFRRKANEAEACF
jgi:hypothetical protein